MNKDQLNQELSFWQEQEAAMLEAALHARQQIHRVQTVIGAITVDELRASGELTFTPYDSEGRYINVG
jgi:hypothetical protein